MVASAHDCPQRLYKYFAEDRVDVLERELIRYSPLGAFNDPFEGRPEIKDLSTHAEAAQLLDEILPKSIADNYGLLPAEAKAVLPFEQFKANLLKVFQSRQNAYIRHLQSFTPLVKSFLSQKFDQHIGALCLSEVPDSLLMWSHYASSHSGFVVAFNAHHKYFHEQRSTEDEFRHLRRVLYRETRPSAPLSSLDATEMFFVKSGHWTYEREWRILRALAEAEQTLPSSPYPISLFSFPMHAVTSVILGARISPKTEKRLRAALRSIRGSHAVTLMRATPDETHFLLRISEEAI